MTLDASRPKCLAGGRPLERLVRRSLRRECKRGRRADGGERLLRAAKRGGGSPVRSGGEGPKLYEATCALEGAHTRTVAGRGGRR